MTRDEAARLARLAAIAALLAERAMVPVAAAQARVAAGRADVERLAAQRAALVIDGADPVQAALLARQADRLRAQQAGALSDLALREAALDLARAAARPAHGRRSVLEQLLRKAGQGG